MALLKVATYTAEKLSKSMAQVSGDAEISGYLVGLLQDVKVCVNDNLKNRPHIDDDDMRIVNGILDLLDNAKTELSCILTTDIRRWTDSK